MNGTTPTTQDTPDKGRLQINLVSDISAYPIQGAQISIFYTGVPEAQLEQLTTDSSGQTDTIDLAAPPLEYSLNPENEVQPYSEYTMQITAEGFESVSIAGAEILADVTAIQNVSMKPIDNPETRKPYSSFRLIHYMPPIRLRFPKTRSSRPSNPERLS